MNTLPSQKPGRFGWEERGIKSSSASIKECAGLGANGEGERTLWEDGGEETKNHTEETQPIKQKEGGDSFPARTGLSKKLFRPFE